MSYYKLTVFYDNDKLLFTGNFFLLVHLINEPNERVTITYREIGDTLLHRLM